MQPGVGPVYDALTREPLGPCADRLGGRDEATGEAGGVPGRVRRATSRGAGENPAEEAARPKREGETGRVRRGMAARRGPVPRAVHEAGAYGRLGKPGPAYPAGIRPRGASAPQRGVIPHGDGPRRGRERPGGSKPSGLKTAFEKQGVSPRDRSEGGPEEGPAGERAGTVDPFPRGGWAAKAPKHGPLTGGGRVRFPMPVPAGHPLGPRGPKCSGPTGRDRCGCGRYARKTMRDADSSVFVFAQALAASPRAVPKHPARLSTQLARSVRVQVLWHRDPGQRRGALPETRLTAWLNPWRFDPAA